MKLPDHTQPLRQGVDLSSPPYGTSRKKQLKGFALVATISVMVLLVMVALAMLSLSTIESRGLRQSSHMVEAQSNARLALMIAIAQLQEHAGPDQRVTARADITDPNWEDVLPSSSLTNPHYTYVWYVSGNELYHFIDKDGNRPTSYPNGYLAARVAL